MPIDARSMLRRPARLAASGVLALLAVAACGSTGGDQPPSPADAGGGDASADGVAPFDGGASDDGSALDGGDAPSSDASAPKLLAAGSDVWIEGVTDDGHAIVHRGASLLAIALADGTAQVLSDVAPAAVAIGGSTVVFWTDLAAASYALDAWTPQAGKQRLSTAANPASYGTPPAVVSADGKLVAFLENVGATKADVVVAASDGSHRQKLVDDAAAGSPFRARIGGNGTVFVEHGSPPALSAFVGAAFTPHDVGPIVPVSPWITDAAGAYAFYPSATSGGYPTEWRLTQMATGKTTSFAVSADKAFFSPSGDAIYFDVPDTLDLQRLPLSSLVPELLVGDTCAHLVGIAPDGSTAICQGRAPSSGPPTLAVVPLKGPSVAAVFQQSAAARSVRRYAYTADGKSIFYFTPDAPSSPDPTLGELDVVAADGSSREVVSPGPYGDGYALTGSLVAYGDAARDEVCVLDASGATARRVVAKNAWTTLGAHGWTKTPDGKSILYVAWGSAPGLYLVPADADASAMQATAPPGIGPGGLLVAGDGIWPVAVTSDGEVLFMRNGLLAADATGGGVIPVADTGNNPLAVVGQTVLYTVFAGSKRPLYAWSKATGSRTITTSSYDLGQYGPGFVLSADATRIAFLDGVVELSTGVTANVAVSNVDGSGKRTVMTGLDVYDCPPQMTLALGGRLFVEGCLPAGDGGTPTPTLWTFELSQTTPSAITLATSPGDWAVAPTGTWAWVTLSPPSSGGELVRADTAQTTPVDSAARAGWFDAAGDTLFYETSPGALLRTPLGGALQPTTLVASGFGARLATSPDGSLFAFASAAASPFDLHLAAAGAPAAPVTIRATADLTLVGDLFTADSRFVVYATEGGTLFAAPVAGGSAVPLAGRTRTVTALHDAVVLADDWTPGELRVVDASGALPPRSVAPVSQWALSPDRKTLAVGLAGAAPGIYVVTLP